MAIKITDECINCGACEPECPNNAIYEGGVEWAISDGTTIKGHLPLWMVLLLIRPAQPADSK
jgi:ferredoxin